MADFESLIIDHVNLGVKDIDRSSAFYTATLAPVGLRDILHIEAERAEFGTRLVGYGREEGRPVFWLVDNQPVGANTHIAFAVDTRDKVRAFHDAATGAGGKDNGAPGIRFYHPSYYGAFVLDPDGINVEAVCHRSE